MMSNAADLVKGNNSIFDLNQSATLHVYVNIFGPRN